MTSCSHDYVNPTRIRRLQYACPKCGQDITMGVILYEDYKAREEERRQEEIQESEEGD